MPYDRVGTLASYVGAPAGVTASLGNPADNTGTAAGDAYEAITGLMGSDFDDTLVGDAAENALVGRAGGDTLVGGMGRDGFFGGPGDDLFYGGGMATGSGLDGSTDVADYS